ncbi:MAG: dihydropteroate synthase [Bdellovibrionota bacterium]
MKRFEANDLNVKIMGIVNITPDSFSDGGYYLSPSTAISHCYKLIEDGADYLDLGAESSRPGSKPIDSELEWQRLKPILNEIHKQNICTDINVKISIDTRYATTMLHAMDYDVSMINNISGLCDFNTLKKLATKPDMQYLAMHMHQNPTTMQQAPLEATNIYEHIKSFFSHAQKSLQNAGFLSENIWLDPGIGFGKTDAANLRLIAHTQEFANEYNLAIGVSRKSWIGRMLKIENPKDRDHPSKMIEMALAIFGAKLIRTHDVKPLVQMLRVLTRDK